MAGQRAELAESLIAGVADHNLAMATQLAIQFAAQGMGNPDRLSRALATEALRTGNPAEAATWAAGLPDGPVKSAAMDRIAGAYVRSNPEEAARWIGQHAGESYAQRAVAEVGREWGQRDPVNALGWLETLPASGGQAYYRRDPESARTWLETSGLSAEAQRAVLNPRRR